MDADEDEESNLTTNFYFFCNCCFVFMTKLFIPIEFQGSTIKDIFEKPNDLELKRNV